jgi:hypothetical protein
MLDRNALLTKTWGILLSLALLIGTGFFWYRGYRTADSFSLYYGGGRRVGIWSQSGQFGLYVGKPLFGLVRDRIGWEIETSSSSFDGSELIEPNYRVFREFGGRSAVSDSEIQVPAWAMALASATPLVIAGCGYYRRRRGRQHASAAPQPAVAGVSLATLLVQCR